VAPVLLVVVVGLFFVATFHALTRGAGGATARRRFQDASEEHPLENGRCRAGVAVVAHVLGMIDVLVALAVIVANRAHPGVVGSALRLDTRGSLLADDAPPGMTDQALVDALAGPPVPPMVMMPMPIPMVVVSMTMVVASMPVPAMVAMTIIAPAVGMAVVARDATAGAPEIPDAMRLHMPVMVMVRRAACRRVADYIVDPTGVIA